MQTFFVLLSITILLKHTTEAMTSQEICDNIVEGSINLKNKELLLKAKEGKDKASELIKKFEDDIISHEKMKSDIIVVGLDFYDKFRDAGTSDANSVLKLIDERLKDLRTGMGYAKKSLALYEQAIKEEECNCKEGYTGYMCSTKITSKESDSDDKNKST